MCVFIFVFHVTVFKAWKSFILFGDIQLHVRGTCGGEEKTRCVLSRISKFFPWVSCKIWCPQHFGSLRRNELTPIVRYIPNSGSFGLANLDPLLLLLTIVKLCNYTSFDHLVKYDLVSAFAWLKWSPRETGTRLKRQSITVGAVHGSEVIHWLIAPLESLLEQLKCNTQPLRSQTQTQLSCPLYKVDVRFSSLPMASMSHGDIFYDTTIKCSPR